MPPEPSCSEILHCKNMATCNVTPSSMGLICAYVYLAPIDFVIAKSYDDVEPTSTWTMPCW